MCVLSGIVSKITPTLAFQSIRLTALQALCTITHHAGEDARTEIARSNPVLVQLVMDSADDMTLLELAIATIAHSTSSVLNRATEPDPGLVIDVGVRSVLEATIIAIRHPTPSRYLISHALMLVTCATRYCPSDAQSVDGALPFLVAFLRSSDICLRCEALNGLIRYTVEDSEADVDSYGLSQALELPSQLSGVLRTYGVERCDTTLRNKCATVLTRAIDRCLKDHDFVSLGRVLAHLIQTTEFSIAEGTCSVTEDVAPPFTCWSEAMPLCVSALRASGASVDEDAADIVECKYLLMQTRTDDAIPIGLRAIARNPGLGYAYYVVSLSGDNAQGLRAAKKGLQCANLKPFVRGSLLWRSVINAAELGLSITEDAKFSSDDRAEGFALLLSAQNDAKAFVENVPPDSRHLPEILNWYALLQFVIKGPDLSPSLTELRVSPHTL